MVKIDGTTITITKGDTLRVEISVYDADGDPYIPQAGDSFRFALKQTYRDDEPLILKPISNDDLLLELTAEETKALKAPSSYVYDIELTMADGTVDTFITGTLRTKEEVY